MAAKKKRKKPDPAQLETAAIAPLDKSASRQIIYAKSVYNSAGVTKHSAGPVHQSNAMRKQASEKRALPAASVPNTPPASVTPAITKQTDTKIIRPPLPVIKKTVPISTPSRHAWAPPKLPFAREIPSLYNETYLRMIPRGPHHIFSFWEIGGEALEKVKEIAGEPDMKPVLRLYVVGPKQGKKADPPMHRVGDISVPPGVYSHYVRVPESGLTYRIDLGVMTASGRFIPLCQSNSAATPRARVQKSAGTESGDDRRPGDRKGIATRKLIDFSLLSGKMIGEAVQDSESLYSDYDEPLAVEPGSDPVPGQGATVSSWGCSSPAPLTGTSAP